MTIVSERWKRLEALFEQALAIDTAARAAWLAGLDVDDDTRRELAGMLDADADRAEEGLTQQFGAAIASAAEVPVPGERLGPYRLLRDAVAASRWEAGGAAMATIRRLVLLNLVLGVATIAIAMLWRTA